MNSEDNGIPSATARGAALRARAQGARTAELGAALSAVDPDLLKWADSFIFGDVWTGEDLPFEDRMLVAIVALAAREQIPQLRNYLHGALQAGIAPARLREALKMLVVYIGFPAAISALSTFRELEARYAAGPRAGG